MLGLFPMPRAMMMMVPMGSKIWLPERWSSFGGRQGSFLWCCLCGMVDTLGFIELTSESAGGNGFICWNDEFDPCFCVIAQRERFCWNHTFTHRCVTADLSRPFVSPQADLRRSPLPGDPRPPRIPETHQIIITRIDDSIFSFQDTIPYLFCRCSSGPLELRSHAPGSGTPFHWVLSPAAGRPAGLAMSSAILPGDVGFQRRSVWCCR